MDDQDIDDSTKFCFYLKEMTQKKNWKKKIIPTAILLIGFFKVVESILLSSKPNHLLRILVLITVRRRKGNSKIKSSKSLWTETRFMDNLGIRKYSLE